MWKILLFFMVGFLLACGGREPQQSAVENKGRYLLNILEEAGIKKTNLQLFLRAFKAEEQLEVWGRSGEEGTFQLLVTYPFCRTSGEAGPKRKEGDRQIPEGVYHIDRFNPNSSFHLSLGLNYPNAADKFHGDPKQPGSDIFIHGACLTVGCIPITDDKIEELYLLCEWAKEHGQRRIPVHLFPGKMEGAIYEEQLKKEFPQHRVFWEQLQKVYLYFEAHRRLPIVEIDEKGVYRVIDN